MRLVTLVCAAMLLAAAAPADPAANEDGSVSTIVGKLRGIKHPPGSAPAPGTAVSPPEAKPEISLHVLFATGSAELTGAGRGTLDRLGEALKDPELSGRHFRIEGHTDTAGSEPLNQALSERRAGAVVDYLATRFAIPRDRLAPVGMGKQGLAVNTPDQVAEPRNRRVVVINLDG